MAIACTIIARNYLAQARVLARSLARHDPSLPLFVLIVDRDDRDERAAADEPFTIVDERQLNIPPDEWRRRAAFYSVTEFSTAVKPALLASLCRSYGDVVVFLDPDVEVFAPLTEAVAGAREHGIVLTPHTMVPLPDDDWQVSMREVLGAGAYNLGFIAVNAAMQPFFDWWGLRVRREALSAPARQMFTDQRWVDLVPSLYSSFVLKHPGYNVAYWNLHARDVRASAGQYFVDGQPLVFFHYSGFDFRHPHLLSRHQGARPRILLSERPDVATLCAGYAEQLHGAGIDRAAKVEYRWGRLRSGLPYSGQMRDVYRESLLAAEKHGTPEPPNPFDPDGDAPFLEWLRSPAPEGPARFSRYARAIYEARVDLRIAFPDLDGDHHDAFEAWLRTSGCVEANVEPSLIQPREQPPARSSAGTVRGRDAARPTSQLAIAGYQRTAHGISTARALVTAAAAAAQLPHHVVDCEADLDAGDTGADVEIWCVNADMTPGYARRRRPRQAAGAYTIGYWFWELEQFPAAMHAAFRHVDEVWAPTTFVEHSLRGAADRPIVRMPLPIGLGAVDASSRPAGGQPFTFLFMFDYLSSVERKNPAGIIAAFERAFPVEGEARLILKSINGDACRNEAERLRLSTRRSDIVFVDRTLTRRERNALVQSCDAYVSLHRSEGLGLTLAEAMAMGKPVIATAYSGNLDFMTPANSFLVDYTMTCVPPGCDPYPVGARWADPDLDHAAEQLRRVAANGRDVQARTRRGQRNLRAAHSPNRVAAALARRIDQIRAREQARAATIVVASPPPLPPPSLAPALPPVRAMAPLISPETRAAFEAAVAAAELRMTPVPAASGTAPLASVRRMGQRAWFRLLRPLWWQQRLSQQYLTEALRSLETRVSVLESGAAPGKDPS